MPRAARPWRAHTGLERARRTPQYTRHSGSPSLPFHYQPVSKNESKSLCALQRVGRSFIKKLKFCTAVRFRIPLFTLMRIQILLFTLRWIRILLLNKVMRICNHWSTDSSWLCFDPLHVSIVSVQGPRWHHCVWASKVPELWLLCGSRPSFSL